LESLTFTTTTLLEATNELLGTIGESAISTLEGNLPRDAERAIKYIHAASRAVQHRGWSFNTDENSPLSRDSGNQIPVPLDALDISFEEGAGLTVRSGKVYNRTSNSFTFDADVTANIVRFLPFDDLPESAKQAVFIRAGLQFQAQTLVEDVLFRFTEAQLNEAMARLENDHVSDTAPNAITDSPDIQQIMRSRR